MKYSYILDPNSQVDEETDKESMVLMVEALSAQLEEQTKLCKEQVSITINYMYMYMYSFILCLNPQTFAQ